MIAKRISVTKMTRSIAVLAGALTFAGLGPASALGTTAPPPAKLCERGKTILSSKAVRSLLRRQGYFSIRALRYRQIEASARQEAPLPGRGVYFATASRGFGIVRWRLSIDPCTGQVVRTPVPTQPQNS